MRSARGHPYDIDDNSIAIIIINYNTCQELQACLGSIKLEEAGEVVVVDNNSSDGSVEMVRSKYPWVTLHANKTNLGYGTAANRAIAGCTAQYVVLLNSDTRLQPGALEALSRYLDQHAGVAIVGPRLVNADGTLQASCYPFTGTFRWLLDNDAWIRLIRYVPVLRNYCLRTWSHAYARGVPCVKGAALAIRREALDAVGGFDESFFMYFEEMDLCYRLTVAGWQIHFAPVTTVVHVGEASTMSYRTDMTVQFAISNLLFCQRHYSRLRFMGVITIMGSIMLTRLIRDTVRLSFTRDRSKRTRIAEDIAAWQRVLLGHWGVQGTRLCASIPPRE
ncbi:MAG: glycosyltransferase family 2 protein [Nitrospirae bacterium]|nr:glycosyltransferase family 2 protein [Nitrospirota bacterium]MDE3050303.1 glycosyltransferase family 2 protein [Nitrospirota bacterium]MDE3218104.1 glycosyltransferase family 2 protein [Nitrospirota bacterium]